MLSTAQFVTAGSVAIARAYAEMYGICPIPINNTFSLPTTSSSGNSQSKVGFTTVLVQSNDWPGAGMEDVIRAVGVAGIPGELHVRGILFLAI